MTTNAKTEFLREVGNKTVTCAVIRTNGYADVDKLLELTTGWVDEEWVGFLNGLDFEYDAGYGSQKLNGTIWYEDGTWSERGEYDGSEWWEHKSRPSIPVELNRIDKVRDKKLNQIL